MVGMSVTWFYVSYMVLCQLQGLYFSYMFCVLVIRASYLCGATYIMATALKQRNQPGHRGHRIGRLCQVKC